MSLDQSRDVASRKLAVTFHPTLTRPVAMAAAAAGRWTHVWLVDVSLGDTPSVLRMLRRLGEVVDVTGLSADDASALLASQGLSGIVCFSDVQLLWTSQVAHNLGLPFFSPESAERLVNKGAQRRALSSAGIPTPGFWELPSAASGVVLDRALTEIASTAAFPVVVKPQESAASRNTFRAADEKELRLAVEECQQEKSGLIVEEMLGDSWPRSERPFADYVSVESILANGMVSHLMVTGKFPLAEPFRETGDFVPSNLEPELRDAAMRLAGESIRVLADGAGVFHTEIKFTPDGPRVIEVNGRIGGMIGEIVDLAADVTTLEVVGEVALGVDVSFDQPVPCKRIAYSADIQAPLEATRLLALENLEEVQRLPGVDGVAVHVRPGEPVNWRTGTLGHVYSVTGTAEEFAELWLVQRRVSEVVVAVYE